MSDWRKDHENRKAGVAESSWRKDHDEQSTQASSWRQDYANIGNFQKNLNADRAYQSYKNTMRQLAAQEAARKTQRNVEDFRDKVNGLWQNPYEKADTAYSRKATRALEDAETARQRAEASAQIGDLIGYSQNKRAYNTAVGSYNYAGMVHDRTYREESQRNLNALKDQDLGYYYYTTMTKDQAQKELDNLNSINHREGFGGRGGKIDSADTDISPEVRRAALDRALKLYGEDEYETTLQQYAPKGYLAEDAKAQRDEGRRRYEADKAAATAAADKAAGAKAMEDLAAGKQHGGMTREQYRTERGNQGAVYAFDEAKHLKFWDADVFYYLYAKDPEAAKRFAEQAKNHGDEQYMEQLSEYAGKNTATRALSMLWGTAENLASGAVNLIDPYSETAQDLNRTGRALISGGAKGLREKGIANTGFMAGNFEHLDWLVDTLGLNPNLKGKGLDDLYQLGSSLLESGALAAASAAAGDFGGALGKVVGFLGTTVMGSSAAVSDYDESIKRGLNRDQAMQHATAAGIAEAAFEYFSLDKLVNQDVTRGFLRNFFVQGGVEASEELFTTIANRITDGYLARSQGYDTQIENRMRELMALGLSRNEAENKAEQEWLADLINDGLGGFVSGGAMTGMNTLANWSEYRASRKQNRNRGYIVRNTDQTQALQKYAEDNKLGWYGREVELADRQGESNLIQKTGDKMSQRQQKAQDIQIGSDTNRVIAHIQEQMHGKNAKEQIQLRDELVEKYGKAIAPSVYEAVSRAAEVKASELGSADEIMRARDQASAGVTDQSIRQAILDGYEDAAIQTANQTKDADAINKIFQDRQTSWGNGGTLNLSVEVDTEDGETKTANIAELGNEKGKVVLDNGETVSVTDLKGVDADVKDVIQAMDEYDLGDDRQKMWREYQTEARAGNVTDGVRWVMNYALAYDQGRTGVITKEEAIKRSSLNPDVAELAYSQGAKTTEDWRQNQIAENEKRRAAAPEGVTGRKGIVDTSNVSKTAINRLGDSWDTVKETAKVLAQGLGVDINFAEQKADAKGNVTGWQGKYHAGQNTITIDINAGLNNIFRDLNTGIMSVTHHELTHWMQENAPTEYLSYKKAVLQAILASKGGSRTLERMIAEVKKNNSAEGKELTRAEAEDEIVADASMSRGQDTDFWGAVTENLGEKRQDVTAKVKEFLSGWFDKLRALIRDASHTSEADRIIRKAEQGVQKNLARLYAEGIGAAMRETGGANENAERADNSQERLSIRPTTDSTGRELSEGQQEYFKDSRARDVNGNLLVLYHQTENEFTVFDPRHEGAGTSDQQTPFGIFLKSSDRDIGVKGKKQMALYANIIKPLVALNRENLERKLRDLFPEYAKLSDQHKALDREYKQKHEQAKQAFTDYLTTWREQHPNAGRREIYQDADFDRLWNEEDEIVEEWEQKARELETETKEVLTNALEAAGYDGIFLGSDTGSWGRSTDAYIALHPEQVKNVDNLNPTKNPDIRYSTRDYSDTSDLDLLLNAAEEISEGGGEDYWASLLREEPGIASEAEEIKRLGNQLRKTEAELEEARRNLTLTDRKLKTRGIASLAETIMKDQKAGDINKKGVKNRIASVLTEAYQKALDQLDEGLDVSDAWETVYQDGVVKAADILLTDATYAEKHGYGWVKMTLGQYLGNGGREYVEADIAARVAQDFDANRYRPGQKSTVADRLVAQAETRLKAKLTSAETDNASLRTENAKLQEANDFYKEQAEAAKATAGAMYQQLLDKREELKNNTKVSADEKKKMLRRLDNLEKQMEAKKKEAAAWKKKAEINIRWAQAALSSKNEDIKAAEEKIEQLQDKLKKTRSKLYTRLKRSDVRKMIVAAREREGKRIAEQKDKQFASYKEKKKATELRSRIKNLSDGIKRRMVNPTERAYVPAALFDSMVKLCDTLDTALTPNSGTKAEAKYQSVMDAIHTLASEYADLKNADNYDYSSEFEQEILDRIGDLERILRKDRTWVDELTGDGNRLREFESNELNQIYNILSEIDNAMKTATKLIGNSHYKTTMDAMLALTDQQKAMRSMNSLGWLAKQKRLRMLNSFNVMRAVEMMSGWSRDAALYQLMHQVEQGVVNSDGWVMDYNKGLQDLKTGKNEKAYRDALNKKLDYGVKDDDGLPVKMTKMQAIQILMTAEREAGNDKLQHLKRGGATIRDALAIQDGKIAKATSQTIKVTPELLQKIRDSITEWDRAYMKALRDYLAKEGKATNKVHYAVKHRVLATEANYVPYIVDKNYLDTKLDEQQATNMWVKAPGSTNALAVKASQPVIIDGMDTVMAKHVKEIADYIGLAIPIRDFSKVYNGQLRLSEDENQLSVKETIHRNFRERGQHLLTQSIIDVQGGGRKGSTWSTGIQDALNKLHGMFVKSALLINPSVTIKQAASYAAAGSILSHKALDLANHPILLKNDVDQSKAMTPGAGLIGHIFAAPNGATATRIYNEIDEHTSMHYIRRQGMSQAEIANEANRSGKLRRAVNAVGASMEQNVIGHAARKAGAALNPVNWIQRMDVATTATLWLACKEQAKIDGKQVGSQEYWDRTTELYERVLRETQPMYDSLHRNAFQKGQGLMQYLFPFRTVPIQNHGQLAAAWETWQASKNKSKTEQKDAAKFLRKTVLAQTESAMVFSLMTFLAAALKRKTRKYRDEDEEFTGKSFLKGFATDTGGTLFSVAFPVLGSEMWSLASRYAGKFEGSGGYTYDAFSVGAVDMMNDLASSWDKIAADLGKVYRGEDVSASDVADHMLAMLKKGLKLAGVPADTVATYSQGIRGNVEDILAGRIPAINDESWERANAVNANRWYKAWNAGDTAKMQTVMDELKESTGGDEDKIRNALATPFRDAYKAGEIGIDEYTRFITESGLFTEKQQKSRIATIARDAIADGDMSEEEAEAYLTDSGYYDENQAWENVQKWFAKAEYDEENEDEDADEFTWSKYDAMDAAIDANKDIKDLKAELTRHGVKEENVTKHIKEHLLENYVSGGVTETSLRNKLSRYCGITAKADANKIVNDANCRKDTGIAYSNLAEAYRSGEIDGSKVKTALSKYGGLTTAEASARVRYWDFQKQNPDANLSQEKLDAYYDKQVDNIGKTVKDTGVPLKTYVSYCEKAANANGTDLDGDGKTDSGSKKAVILDIIDALNLSDEQKDVLYYLNGYSAKTIGDAPWHK